VTTASTLGPFQTEREARETLAVQAIYEAFDQDPGAERMAPHNYRMLEAACEAAAWSWARPTAGYCSGYPSGNRPPAQS